MHRFDRTAPNAGTPPPSSTVAPIRDPLFGGTVDANVALWFHNPHNRFVCSHSCSGFQFGYVFCGSQIWWYWWWPNCAPCFRPYCYYWRPSCYYLPCYYPSYASVAYVNDYWDDGSYYPSYAPPPSESRPEAAPAPSAADADALLVTGWQQFKAGSYPESLESFRQAVLARPDDPQAKVAFAQALFAIGNYPDAAFLIRRAFELLPDWPVTGEDPRARYADPAEHAEQMVALRSFLEHVPADPAATLVLAVQNYFTGDFAAAKEEFSLLAALDPEDLVAKRFLERLGPPSAPPSVPGLKEVPKADH
jgi:tetratricopeptide (TPR) repeat protein